MVDCYTTPNCGGTNRFPNIERPFLSGCLKQWKPSDTEAGRSTGRQVSSTAPTDSPLYSACCPTQPSAPSYSAQPLLPPPSSMLRRLPSHPMSVAVLSASSSLVSAPAPQAATTTSHNQYPGQTAFLRCSCVPFAVPLLSTNLLLLHATVIAQSIPLRPT